MNKFSKIAIFTLLFLIFSTVSYSIEKTTDPIVEKHLDKIDSLSNLNQSEIMFSEIIQLLSYLEENNNVDYNGQVFKFMGSYYANK